MSKKERLTQKSLIELSTEISTLDLVVIKNKMPVANTEHLRAYEVALIEHTDDMVRNTLDIDILEEEIKKRTKINSNFKTHRLGFTKPMTAIPKEFTPFEKSFDEQNNRIKDRVEEMKESTFRIAEAKIREVLNLLQEEHKDIQINMSVFEDFVEAQRKVKGMLPKDNGSLSKGSMDKIEKVFNDHIQPIIEAKEKEERSQTEHKQFQTYLPNTDSNSINELEAAKMNLLKQKERLEELYPINFSFFTQTIVTMIGKIESNIKAINAEAKKVEAEAEAQKLRDVDKPITDEITKLSDEFKLKKEDNDWIEKATITLRALYKESKMQETKKIAIKLSDEFKAQQTNNLATFIIEPIVKEKIIEEKRTEEPVIMEESEPLKRIYSLVDEQAVMFDIEAIRVEAMSEEEAIEKYVEAFRKSITKNGVR